MRRTVVLNESALHSNANAHFVACVMNTAGGGMRASSLESLLRNLLATQTRQELLRAVIVVVNTYVDVCNDHDKLSKELPPQELVVEYLQDSLGEHDHDLLDETDWDNLLLFLEAKLFHANCPQCPSLQHHTNLELMQVDPLMFELEHLF